MTYKVAVVVGSLRRESFNRQLAQAVISLAPADFTFEFLEIGNLPLYSQDYDADFPEVARNLKQKISEANALLFVTPEYNRSIPGVLKNAIDWGSRPWGHSAWGGKPGAVTPQGMLQKRRARLWLADVNVNTAATRHFTVPCRQVPGLAIGQCQPDIGSA